MKSIGICILSDAAIHVARAVCRRRNTEVVALHRVDHVTPNSLWEITDWSACVDAIVEALHKIGPVDEMRLVIPAQWCFVHGLSTSGSNEREWAYLLEEFLPVDLESVTCAFETIDKITMLAVAVPTAPIQELLRALSDRSIDFAQIQVDVLSAARASDVPPGGSAVIIDERWVRVGPFHDELGIACFSSGVVRQGPTNSPGDRGFADQSQCVEFDLRNDPPPLCKNDAEESATTKRLVGSAAIQAIGRGACTNSTLDLRCGALAAQSRWQESTRLMNHCLATLAVLFLVTAICLRGHAMHLRSEHTGIMSAMSEVYQTAIPGEPPPSGWAMRLSAQRRQLEGLTRPANDKRIGPDAAAMDRWRDIVAAWPPDVPLQLTEARLEGGQVSIRGRAREHRDAERLAESMATVAGLATQPPRTNRTTDGLVEFTLSAAQVNEAGGKDVQR